MYSHHKGSQESYQSYWKDQILSKTAIKQFTMNPQFVCKLFTIEIKSKNVSHLEKTEKRLQMFSNDMVMRQLLV